MMVVKGRETSTEKNRGFAVQSIDQQLKKRIGNKIDPRFGFGGCGLKLSRIRDPFTDRRFTFSTTMTRKAEPKGDNDADVNVFRQIQPTTYQKVRRILEEHARRRDNFQPIGTIYGNDCRTYFTNYSIVASSTREKNVSRNSVPGKSFFSSFSVCETPRPLSVEPRLGRILGAGPTARKTNKTIGNDFRIDEEHRNIELPSVHFGSKTSKYTIRRENVVTRPKDRVAWVQGVRVHPEKVDKKNVSERKKNDRTRIVSSCSLKSSKSRRKERGQRIVISKEGGTTATNSWKENGPITTSSTRREYGHVGDLRRSPSSPSRTFPSSWKKNVTVKKSVSFSSDTSFEEKRSLVRAKTTVHEAKEYRKGVLQDRAPTSHENARGSSSTRTTTTTTTSTSGGSAALLRAARSGNDSILGNILIRSRTSRSNMDLDINATDSSGRTAVSYLAGNGTVALLEAALCFPDADVNLADNEGNTPLHFAAQAGQVECVSALLQRCSGIEVDARNGLGFTPLMKAAIQGRTKCAKLLLFAGANPTLRDQGRGLRAEQWARFCGRYVCAEVIERFARHRLLERTTSCRWGSEPELAAKVLQGKVTPMPTNVPQQSTGLRSKIRRVFRTSSGPDNRRSFSLVSQLTSAALCASSPALPRSGDVPPVVKSLIRPLSVPQLRITLVASPEMSDPVAYKSTDKYQTCFTEKIVSEKIDSAMAKPPRTKKKNK